MRGIVCWTVIGIALASSSCLRLSEQPLTAGQAKQALEEAATAFRAEGLVSNTVELNTNFTLGGAVEEAAQQLRDFVVSQLPCAEVTVDGASVSIEYGAMAGDCAYHGHTYRGTHTVTLLSVDEDDVVVQHEWDQVDDGLIMVDGEATVTWDLTQQTRRVEHELEWTDLQRHKSFTGSGDRRQGPLSMSWALGITVDGYRDWTSDRGDWHLDIDGVQARWDDPVPQAGTYTLQTPFDDKTVTLRFERVDDDTIAVTAESGKRNFSFNVNKLGIISE